MHHDSTTPTPSNPPTPSDPSTETGTTLHKLEQQRRDNAQIVRELGLEPYGSRVDGVLTMAQGLGRYDQAADEAQKEHGKEDGFQDERPVVTVGGRIVLHRDNGKLIWLNLRDATGDLQIAVSKRDCDEAGFALAKAADLSDIVVASGPLVRTRTGEITIWATSLVCGAKSLVPPPEKHAGLADVEARYRHRYVDLWANPETAPVFILRSRLITTVRSIMEAHGFVEVETPILQTQPGGAAARPFITHMNALDMDLYLRIAPELYLKRLLVGGMPRVYEINRSFRNEGLDTQHNPEFTMLEGYEAFGDCDTVMGLVEEIIRTCAGVAAEARSDELGAKAVDSLSLPWGECVVDYASPFKRIAYGELFERALGFAMSDMGRAREEAAKRGMRTKTKDGVEIDDVFVINELFEKAAEATLDAGEPTFITEYPAAISPLTRPKPGEPAVAERADLFIGGMELAPHYTELNDPDVQEAKFRQQLSGLDDDESTFRTFDADFVHALKVGMPPAGGFGLGIDRMVMLLTGQRTIRDVVLFPQMRSQGDG